MAFNLFNKKLVVGVSVNPEIGLEVAQIDYENKQVLKYASRQLAFDNVTRNIVDMDIFKETLQELLTELDIPKGSEIVINIPPVLFKVADYPASLSAEQITGVIEDELIEHPVLKESEPCLDLIALPNSTMQVHKVACTVAHKVTITEFAIQVKDLGYTLLTVDSTVNSVLNALMYNSRVDCNPSSKWLLLIVENNCFRLLPIQGKNYVDCIEEKLSIGEVLGDAENYSTVVSAISPYLKNIPAQFLFVVSNTNIISAKILADKLKYNAPIIHQEANFYATEPFIDVADNIDDNVAKSISLGVIGAAINREFATLSNANFNLFNKSLGDVYLMEQPPEIFIAGRNLVLSLQNMIVASIVVAVPVVLAMVIALTCLAQAKAKETANIEDLKNQVAQINRILKENEQVSSEMFDEGDEIRVGITHNKNIYQYYTIVGTEIPQKVWLTSLKLGEKTVIEGQADNLESIYAFFRNVKDYGSSNSSPMKLQKLALASTSKLTELNSEGDFDTDSILTSMNADFYEFMISDDANAVSGTSNAVETDALGLPKINL